MIGRLLCVLFGHKSKKDEVVTVCERCRVLYKAR